MAILAASVVVIMQALMRGAHTLTIAENRLRAYAFSAMKLADVELALSQGGIPTPRGQFRAGRDLFTWSIESAPFPEEPALELVTLSVGWQGGGPGSDVHVSMLQRLAAAE